MTSTPKPDLLDALRLEVRSLRDVVDEFRAEFNEMSDTELDQMIGAETEIADTANWRADCALAEMRLRKLRAVFAPPA